MRAVAQQGDVWVRARCKEGGHGVDNSGWDTDNIGQQWCSDKGGWQHMCEGGTHGGGQLGDGMCH